MIRNQIIMDVIEEYLEEAAFLYEHGCNLQDNPEIGWRGIEDFENRLEAHLDGLVLAEEVGLEACKQRVKEGDPLDLFTALCVFCRQRQKERVMDLLDNTDLSDPACLTAVTDALKHELPPEWHPDVLEMLTTDHTGKNLVAAKVIGFQRIAAGGELVQAMLKKDAVVTAAVAWAIGRTGCGPACERLVNLLTILDDEKARINITLALLRLGDTKSLDYCLSNLRLQTWPALPIGLAGGRSAFHPLQKMAGTEAEGLVALGVLGDIRGMDFLLSRLDNPATAEFAAMALNLITGAQLSEEIVMTEAVEEDELLEEQAQTPEQAAGQSENSTAVSQTTLQRLSRSAEAWRTWWQAHQADFNPLQRYRSGQTYSPTVLLENLTSEHTSPLVRHIACEELAIRYGVAIPIETDMYVRRQIRILNQYKEAVANAATRFKAGSWYFAGQELGG